MALNRAPQSMLDLVTITLEEFGAVGDGVTDDTIAINNAIAYAESLLQTVSIAEGKAVTIYGGGNYVVSSQILISSKRKLSIEIKGGISVANWTGAITDPVITIDSPYSYHSFNVIDCNKLCAGVVVSAANVTFYDTAIFHFKTFGLRHTDSSGNCNFNNVTVWQWLQADTEFATDAEWDAIGIEVDGIDSKWTNCNAAWTGIPLKLTSNASTHSFINCHIWNGRPPGSGPKPTDQTIIESYASSSNYMMDCYFDNGYIKIYDSPLIIDGGLHLYLTANVTLTHPMIRYYRDTASTNPTLARIYNLRTSVGFFDGTSGAFAGNYRYLNQTALNGTGESTIVTRGLKYLQPTTEDRFVSEYYKPEGDIKFKYQTVSPTGATVASASRSRTSNVVTITTSVNHSFYNGMEVTISCPADTTFNATNVTITATSATTFTYANTGADVGTTADTGIVITYYSRQQEMHFKFNEVAVRSPVFRIQAKDGYVPHALILGGGEVGIREDVGGRMSVWTNGAAGWLFLGGTDRSLTPNTDVATDVGSTTKRVRSTYQQVMALVDGITEPATVSGHAVIYIDSSDGDLKIKYSDGHIKTISNDS
jgi:hypothetical protein